MSTPYLGTRRSLLLAFDVGTTFSGVSYSVLDPDQVPQIKGVNLFPGQTSASGSSKVPTVVYYDRRGEIRAIGAETLRDSILIEAEDGGWMKVEWFKLHLRPNPERTPQITQRLPPLPVGKEAYEVLADFFRYLFKCAHDYIVQSESGGTLLWDSVHDDIKFVLSHPNGWAGIQQTHMRRAAIRAGLVEDSDAGKRRIFFVTEGEASLHYAIRQKLPDRATRHNDGVAIVDAGGGTIDISAYSRARGGPGKIFEEIAPPQCHFKGSVFVSFAARLFLEEFLQESKFIDDLDHIVRCFDRTTKLIFRNDQEPQYVKFGSTRDNDPEFDIRFGQLKLSGTDVASFFEPAINRIVEAVQEQRRTAHRNFTHVVLVGGFAINDWLFNRVKDALVELGYTVIRPIPDDHVRKAVSDGAISQYLDRFVRTRVSKLTYGTKGAIDYNDANEEHQQRASKTFTSISGLKRIDDVFWVILASNIQVPESKEIRRRFYWEFTNITGLSSAKAYLYCYNGLVGDAAWMDINPERYGLLLTIEVDLSHLAESSEVKELRGAGGRTYYKVSYEVVMMFGGTETKVALVWKHHGREIRSDAKILYNENLPFTESSSYEPPPFGPAPSAPQDTPAPFEDARSVRSSIADARSVRDLEDSFSVQLDIDDKKSISSRSSLGRQTSQRSQSTRAIRYGAPGSASSALTSPTAEDDERCANQ